MTTHLFSRFFSSQEDVDPNLFSRLQLYIAAHPDVETSCVLANLFRALYTNSELFFIESLQRLDAASQNVARELMQAKASNVFPKEVWENALELIAALPAERGGFGNNSGEIATKAPFAFTEASANADPAIGSQAWFRAWALYFKWRLRRGASSAFAFAARREGFDNFKYLWGAPAAAGVMAASFGLVLLDERLGFRQIILSSPPAHWIAEVVAGKEKEETPGVAITPEPNITIARLHPQTKLDVAPLDEPRTSAVEVAAPAMEEPAPAAPIETVAASTEPVAAEGALGRAAIVNAVSARERPVVAPREGQRPEQQTKPRPVPRAEPPVIVVPPPAAAKPPLPEALVIPPIAKIPLIPEPVTPDPVSPDPVSPPTVNVPAGETLATAKAVVHEAAPPLANEVNQVVENIEVAEIKGKQAVPDLIKRLQGGGAGVPDAKPAKASPIERIVERAPALDRDAGSIHLGERSARPDAGSGAGIANRVIRPLVQLPDRNVVPERPAAVERPLKADRPLAPERPLKADRPLVPERPLVANRPLIAERPLRAERPDLAQRPPAIERPVIERAVRPVIERVIKPELGILR